MGNAMIRVDDRHIKTAGAMLGRAFYEDPFYGHLMPDDAGRKEKARYVFECITRYGIRYGEVYAVSPAMEGATIWMPSDEAEMTVGKMLAVGLVWLGFRMGPGFVFRTFPALDYVTRLHEKHAPFRHSYLFVLAVDTDQRGRKYASALLRPMLARLDKEGLPCYLETCKEVNIPLYEHFGFKVCERGVVPGTSVPVYPMLRAPGAGGL